MDINGESQLLVAHLIKALMEKLQPKTTLAIDRAYGTLFIASDLHFDQLWTRENLDRKEEGAFDLVVANAPFGAMVTKESGNARRKQPASLALISYAIQKLGGSGRLLINVEPGWAYGFRGSGLRDLLAREGCCISAFFITPAGFYLPWTALRAPFLLIQRGTVENEFTGEIDSTLRINQVIKAFLAGAEGYDPVVAGCAWLPLGTFRGPAQHEVNRQIENIQSDYKAFQLKGLGVLATTINAGRTGVTFAPAENAIYIPSIGSLDVVTALSDTTKKHQNYFQVLLNPDTADNEYLKAYLSTDLGQLSLEALVSDSYIPRIIKSTLLQLEIPLPNLAIQKSIVNTIQKLDHITDAIKGFANNLSINPLTATASADKIDLMLEVIGELADSDKVGNIIRGGESKTVEFKQTLSLDIRKDSKERYIEDMVIKTIAAFLNSEGGTLLVGVDDLGAIKGVRAEIEKLYKSADKFLLHVKDSIKSRIGEPFYPFINHRLVTVAAEQVLMVACKPSTSAVYVDGKDFYVRTNPATDKLEGPKLVEYVRNHFVK